MSADYYFFAPTGGRYQTVFRGTLPRRYSIKRSRWDNALTPSTIGTQQKSTVQLREVKSLQALYSADVTI